MVTQDNFRGVVVESWPVKEIKHKIEVPARKFEWFRNPHSKAWNIAQHNPDYRCEKQLLGLLIENASLPLQHATLDIAVTLKCDRIEQHTAQFLLEDGREYLLKHPKLRRSFVNEISIFWRSIYLVRNGIKYPIIRTNWKETKTFDVSPEHDFTLSRVSHEHMKHAARHPVFLPMNAPANVAFLHRSNVQVVPAQDGWWPEYSSVELGIRDHFNCLTTDFTALGESDKFDIHEHLIDHLGTEAYPQELREYTTLGARGKELVKRIEKIYNQPVFQVRGSGYSVVRWLRDWSNWNRLVCDPWTLVSGLDAHKFVPVHYGDAVSKVVVQKNDEFSKLFCPVAVDTSALRYKEHEETPSAFSERLEELFSAGTPRQWRESIVALTSNQ